MLRHSSLFGGAFALTFVIRPGAMALWWTERLQPSLGGLGERRRLFFQYRDGLSDFPKLSSAQRRRKLNRLWRVVVSDASSLPIFAQAVDFRLKRFDLLDHLGVER